MIGVSNDEYLFHLRVVQADSYGHYVTRWDRAVELIVTAKTQNAALAKVSQVLGLPRAGNYWATKVDRVEPAPVAAGVQETTPKEGDDER